MKFTLTYDGELRSNSGPKRKWEIRKHLAPQLAELWRITPVLQDLVKSPWVPMGQGYMLTEVHHSSPNDRDRRQQSPTHGDWLNLLLEVPSGSRRFFPLVRNSLALRCGLSILFLRKETPGRIYQGGDLDNRIKTLLDALSAPKPEQIVDDPTIENPIYCLVEDDSLISALNVETRRLLIAPNENEHTVRLVIEVDIRIDQPRSYNYRFLSD